MVSPLISALLGAGEQYMADEDASDQLKGDIIDAASKKYFDVDDKTLSSSQYVGLTIPIVEFLCSAFGLIMDFRWYQSSDNTTSAIGNQANGHFYG